MKPLKITQKATLGSIRKRMPRPTQVIVDKVTKRRSRKAKADPHAGGWHGCGYDDNCLPSL